MTVQRQHRHKLLIFKLNETEFKKLQEDFSNSTKRNRSEYLRSLIMGKPIAVYTRNKSLDLLLDEMILLRRELHAIGNDFHQAVKKLLLPPPFPEREASAIFNEKSRELLFKKIEEIEEKIIQIDNQCLPSSM
jgi:hypothetical protein